MRRNIRYQSRRRQEQKKRSERILPRARREKIYSLLNDVIGNAKRAQRACLEEEPSALFITTVKWKMLSDSIDRLKAELPRIGNVFYIGRTRFEWTK